MGQQIIKHLQENDTESNVKEIRVVDVVPFENRIGYKEKIPVKGTVADVTKVDTDLRLAFKDVDTVFHCAAFISISYPPKTDQLERVNVEGSIKICNFFKLLDSTLLLHFFFVCVL